MLWDPESPELRRAVVCYADILGFKGMTYGAFRSGQPDALLLRIKRALDLAHEDIRRFAAPLIGDSPIFEMKLFTDNFLVAFPIQEGWVSDGEGELGTVLLMFLGVQARLAFEGFFLRGAVTVGEHYQSGDIVYGKALLDAVGLDKSGGSPRLVVDRSVEPMMLEHLGAYGGGDSPYHHTLLEDPEDGYLFLDYLQAVLGDFPDFCTGYEPLADHRHRVSESLREHEYNQYIRRKYEWVATYHDYALEKVAGRYSGWYSVLDPEHADGEEFATVAAASGLLDYRVPVELIIEGVDAPLPFDVERLRRRVKARRSLEAC